MTPRGAPVHGASWPTTYSSDSIAGHEGHEGHEGPEGHEGHGHRSLRSISRVDGRLAEWTFVVERHHPLPDFTWSRYGHLSRPSVNANIDPPSCSSRGFGCHRSWDCRASYRTERSGPPLTRSGPSFIASRDTAIMRLRLPARSLLRQPLGPSRRDVEMCVLDILVG